MPPENKFTSVPTLPGDCTKLTDHSIKMDETTENMAKALMSFIAKTYHQEPAAGTNFFVLVKRLVGITTRTSSMEAMLTPMHIPIGEQWPPGEEPIFTKLTVVAKTLLDSYLTKLTELNEQDVQDVLATLSPRPLSEEIKTQIIKESAEENVVTGSLLIFQEYCHSMEVVNSITVQRNIVSDIYRTYLMEKEATMDHYHMQMEVETVDQVQYSQDNLRRHWQELVLNIHRFSDLIDNVTPGDIGKWGIQELAPFDLATFLKGNQNRPDLAMMNSDRTMVQANQESKAVGLFFNEVRDRVKKALAERAVNNGEQSNEPVIVDQLAGRERREASRVMERENQKLRQKEDTFMMEFARLTMNLQRDREQETLKDITELRLCSVNNIHKLYLQVLEEGSEIREIRDVNILAWISQTEEELELLKRTHKETKEINKEEKKEKKKELETMLGNYTIPPLVTPLEYMPWATAVQCIKTSTRHMDSRLRSLIMESLNNPDVKKKVQAINDPVDLIKSIEDNLGTTEKLITECKRRVKNMNTPSNWGNQTVNCENIRNLIIAIKNGPGLEAWDEELFALMISKATTRETRRKWEAQQREAVVANCSPSLST